MKDKNLQQLKNEYMDVPIPKELDFVVKKALKDSGVNEVNKKSNFKRMRIAAASIAAIVAIIIVGVNSSPALALTLSKAPVVGGIVKVLTFREYTVNEDKYQADIKVPSIQGLNNKALENSLNEKYLTENKKLYEGFMDDMENLKKNQGGHIGINSGFMVKTDTDRILSVENFTFSTVNSLSKNGFVTIDKKNEILITLPSLFKDHRYVDIISENIKKQMVEQNKADKNKFYWVEGIDQNGTMELFEKISKDQSFYIDKENKLIICFEKFEVAPGYMGNVEFVIPTEILLDSLVSNEYIK
ncbi:RsiV family protein [Clostridium sp.]|uniref:RsiV family protein n=1 Tax=Clostridium sp. TaxID=1506 RepID=UPI002FC99EBF